ncbi:MAG TPA: polysaccharide deacetylase family protein [Stellaceae bacterium]|nr:polysaccharide deacetylase family protein [Stellaceae bacterium]
MTYMPQVAAKVAEWPDLAVELDRWEEAGKVARFWWRDDDAAMPNPQLDRLLAVADGAPLALAVIPADVKDALAAALRWQPQVAVLHHGWCHANRAASGKKSEYPPERHPVEVADELDEGRKRLRTLFGSRAHPVFVPPWNRFSERFVPLLTEAGFVAVSQMAPRKTAPPRGIAAIDVHLDIVAWHADRGFIGEAAALGGLVVALRARREAGDGGAVGLLTHHLVLDAPSEAFLARFGALVDAHAAARWAGIGELIA